MFMRKAMEKGHIRKSNKLRSFMMAAFQVAITASSNPKTPLCFHGYGVTSNPAAATVPDDSANQPDKNPLSLQELDVTEVPPPFARFDAFECLPTL
jgi:hypothetical protein